MSEQIRMILLLLVSVTLMVVSVNTASFAKSSKFLKEDMEVAVHDAALQLDPYYLSEGLLVFDEVKAREVFEESMIVNTGMDINDYEILEFQVFDESNSTFPMEFISSEVNFQDIFIEPTILVILKTNTQSYYLTTKKRDITKAASYTYDLE